MSRHTEKHRNSHTFGALANLMSIRAVCFSKFFRVFVVPIIVVFFSVFSSVGNAYATDYQFSLTTIPLAANSTFQFTISAGGVYYVDCGDGGTLSGTGVSGNTITKNNRNYTYTCTYSTAGAKTIRFGSGTVEVYAFNTYPAIGFYVGADNTAKAANAAKIASLDGSLGAMFPSLGLSTSGNNPRFTETFKGCVNLTSIPDTLFSGNMIGIQNSFQQTFEGCTSLTSIPETLFSDVTPIGSSHINNMFNRVFYGCTSLTTLPEGLFSTITVGSYGMFDYAFYGCTGLTGYIPASMFSGLIDNGVTGVSMRDMFSNTGDLMTSCPTGTTQYVTGYESSWGGHVACKGNSYYVTYSCGIGGGDAPSTATATYNESFTPAANTCTVPAGYSGLSGWLVSGTSDVKQPGTAFKWTYAEDKTLTAQWTQINYTVSFAAGSAGGSTPSGSTSLLTNKHYGDTITLPSSGFTAPTGYSFNGWSCNNSIGNKAAGATFSMPAANVTCTAQWTPKNITLNWYNGDTKITPSNNAANNCTYDDALTIPSNPPSKTGYVFAGWKIKVRPTMDFSTLTSLSTGEKRWAKGLFQNADYCWYKEGTGYATQVSCDSDIEFEELELHEWKVQFSTGTMYGTGYCSAKSGNHSSYTWPTNDSSNWLATYDTLESTSGEKKYCWCQATGWKPSTNNPDGTIYAQSSVSASSAWVLGTGYGSAAYCAQSCADRCSSNALYYSAFRGAVATGSGN